MSMTEHKSTSHDGKHTVKCKNEKSKPNENATAIQGEASDDDLDTIRKEEMDKDKELKTIMDFVFLA